MRNITGAVCLLIALALLAYTGIRCHALSFTHDESFTYLYSAQNTFLEIVNNNTTQVSANNHILNTLLMKLSATIFGPEEFFLRLHSLLALFVYLLFSWRLVKQFTSPVTIISGFILLTVNPYLLGFFSVARGYGMAISFMMISTYYFISFTRSRKTKHLVFSLAGACLAVLSNFGLLNFFLALVIVYQFYLAFNFNYVKVFIKKNIPVLITVAVMAAICYEPLRVLIQYDQLQFGGTEGLWADTVCTLVMTYLLKEEFIYTIVPIIVAYAVVAAIALYSLILIAGYFRRALREEEKAGAIVLALLIMIAGSTWIQHQITGEGTFLRDRFAVFIVPLFMLVFVHLLDLLINRKTFIRLAGYTMLSAIPALAIINSIGLFNLEHAVTWKYDADTEAMVMDLKQMAAGKARKVRLGITWPYEPSINFYRMTRELDWLEPVTREGIEGEYDFYYIMPEDREKLGIRNKTLIKLYPAGGALFSDSLIMLPR